MKIFPAIDILDGRAVRLYRGDYGKSTVYSEDAVSLVKRFYDEGARFLHIVDLDGARDGRTSNFKLIERLISASDMFCEVGGGIRGMDAVNGYLNVGAGRVILGTSAINDPAFLKEAVQSCGEKTAVAVDVRDGRVAVKGWRETLSEDGLAFCAKLRGEGVRHVIYTDISRDGTLSGIDPLPYEMLSRIEGLKVTASGGISSASEITILKKIGVDAAILGKALYEGKLILSDILRIAEETNTGGIK